MSAPSYAAFFGVEEDEAPAPVDRRLSNAELLADVARELARRPLYQITDLLQAAAAIAWSAGVSLDDYLQCASLAWPTGASITPPPDPTAVTTAAALAGDQPGQGAPFDEVAVSRG